MKPLKRFAEKFPWLFALLGIVLVLGVLNGARLLLGVYSAESPDKELLMGAAELTAATVVYIVFALFTGLDRLSFSRKGMKYGFRLMMVLLIVMGAVSLFQFIGGLKGGFSFEWKKIAAFFLMLSVGILEEFTCRGMLFGGLLKCLGKTYKGVLAASLISGFLFGFIHVIGSLMQGDVNSVSAVLQAAAKTVSTGMTGVILAAIYLKTRNIWVPVVLHCIYDGLSFITTFIFVTENTVSIEGAPSYVLKGKAGIAGAGVMLILAGVTVPFFIKALKEMKKMSVPAPWPLEDRWYEEDTAEFPAGNN